MPAQESRRSPGASQSARAPSSRPFPPWPRILEAAPTFDRIHRRPPGRPTAEVIHERHPQRVRPADRPALRGGHATLPGIAQGLRGGIPAGHPGAHARGHPDPDPDQRGAGGEPARPDLRHLGTLYGPEDPDRSDGRSAGCARRLDRRARRHRAARRADLRVRPPAPGRPRSGQSALRPPAHPQAGQAGGQCHPDALRAPRDGDPGDGVRGHPREHAPGRPARRPALYQAPAPAWRAPFRRQPARRDHPRVRARRGGPWARHHPRQHQPPRARAHDHRAQLPGEDQHQHRQLGRHLFDRGGGREDGLVGALGRRHPDGPVHGKEHPRDPGVDPAQRPHAHRDRAHLPGTGEGER